MEAIIGALGIGILIGVSIGYYEGNRNQKIYTDYWHSKWRDLRKELEPKTDK